MLGITSGLVDGTLMAGDCVLTATRHQPLLKLSVHDHEHANINIVADGYVDEAVERLQFSCEPFSSLLKPPGARHANRYGGKETRCLIIEFLPQFYDCRNHCPAISKVRHTRSPGSRTLARRIWFEFWNRDSAAPLIIEGLVLELLGSQLRGRNSVSIPRWLERCRDILESNLLEPISISALSRRLDIDRSHLTKEFRRHYGVSPGLYVRQRRLEKALELLRSTKKPISVIALELGFADQSHFARTFASEIGTTPSKFRCSSS
jgi:AraC family transcriptional regulator